MEEKRQYIATLEDAGKRLDMCISEWQGISRTKAKELITEGAVFCNTVPVKKASYSVGEGDVFHIDEKERSMEEESTLEDTVVDYSSSIRVIEETDTYLVVDKPAGMLTHPTDAKEPYTLTEWLVTQDARIADVGENLVRPGIVHRLDKAASGVLVIAKTQDMFVHLKQQFKKRTVEKEYLVLVHGNMDVDHDVIDFAIDRGRDGKMVSRPKVKEVTLQTVMKIQPGKEAKTEFTVLERYQHYTLLRVKIHTGRTHQIRVHMHAYGHPVVGDGLYYQKQYARKKAERLDRLFLHAARLCFAPLRENTLHCFEAPLREELEAYLRKIQPRV